MIDRAVDFDSLRLGEFDNDNVSHAKPPFACRAPARKRICLTRQITGANIPASGRYTPCSGYRKGHLPARQLTLLAGLVLRGWSFKTLGDYFTFTVIVSTDQPVVTAGPYRLLRHPSYSGILLMRAESPRPRSSPSRPAKMVETS